MCVTYNFYRDFYLRTLSFYTLQIQENLNIYIGTLNLKLPDRISEAHRMLLSIYEETSWQKNMS